MINFLTAMRLVKPTILFILNLKRLKYLMAIPALFTFFVLLTEAFFPLFSLAETAEIKMLVNFYMFFLLSVVFIFLVLSLMQRVQQIIFFGEPDEKDKIFFPFPNKAFFAYFADVLYIFVTSLFFAAISAYILFFAVNYFLPLPEWKNLFVLLGMVVLLPYFMIRFCLILPASVAEKKLRFWDSWKMTGRISPIIALVSALFLLLPLGMATILYTVFQTIIENTALIYFVTNFCAVFSLLFSSVLFAAYVAYLYSLIIEQS